MSLEITGKLVQKYDTQQVSDRFKKREFVLEIAEEINGNIYTNYAKMQLVQNKCDIIDRFGEGDLVKVNFNIKGNRWEKDGRVNYITNLDAWRVEQAGSANPQGSQSQQQPASSYQGNGSNGSSANSSSYYNNNNGGASENVDDLPF